eukprot:8487727-Alexandrium_andersonii.AAC.1
MVPRTTRAQVPLGTPGGHTEGALELPASSGEANLPGQRRRSEPVEVELGRVLVPVGNLVGAGDVVGALALNVA